MPELITDYDKEWLFWAELFVQLWPKMMLDDLAEMADRMLHTFGEGILSDVKKFLRIM